MSQGHTRFATLTVLPDGIPRLLVPAENRRRRVTVTVRGTVQLSASPNPVGIPAVGFPITGVSSETFLAATQDVFVLAPDQPLYALSVVAVGFNGISAAISDMLE